MEWAPTGAFVCSGKILKALDRLDTCVVGLEQGTTERQALAAMSRSLHFVEEARLRCIYDFGHPRPKAEVPNELICLDQAHGP